MDKIFVKMKGYFYWLVRVSIFFMMIFCKIILNIFVFVYEVIVMYCGDLCGRYCKCMMLCF